VQARVDLSAIILEIEDTISRLGDASGTLASKRLLEEEPRKRPAETAVDDLQKETGKDHGSGPKLIVSKYARSVDSDALEALPASFSLLDSIFSPCIHPPTIVQGACNNCYAHAVASTMSDRYCIYEHKDALKSGGMIPVDSLEATWLSPQDLTSCGGGDGCVSSGAIGNSVGNAFIHAKEHGVVLNSCMPYVSHTGITGMCQTKCADGSSKVKVKAAGTVDFRATRHHGSSLVKLEIMENGPVTAGMKFYGDDFHAFFEEDSDGIYIANVPENGKSAAHAVKIIGWGEGEGTFNDVVMKIPYWLCQNSWGPNTLPYFKIANEQDLYTRQADERSHSVDFGRIISASKGPYQLVEDFDGAVGTLPQKLWEPASGIWKYHHEMAARYGRSYDGALPEKRKKSGKRHF